MRVNENCRAACNATRGLSARFKVTLFPGYLLVPLRDRLISLSFRSSSATTPPSLGYGLRRMTFPVSLPVAQLAAQLLRLAQVAALRGFNMLKRAHHAMLARGRHFVRTNLELDQADSPQAQPRSRSRAWAKSASAR